MDSERIKTEPVIRLNRVTLTYRELGESLVAVREISFDVHEGEFVCLLGPSGCGKSTLLHLIAGLLMPTEGRVEIRGEAVTGPGTDRGIVFQSNSLFPWMTARKNISFGLRQVSAGRKESERLEIADRILREVGLAGFEKKYPSQLSGGMKQRVAIARAFAMDTGILLMDEPFSAVDPYTRYRLQKLLLSLWEQGDGKRKTVVFVTHDIDEAILLSDRVILMNTRPGTVAERIRIPFERPRELEALRSDPRFAAFRREILKYFDQSDTEGGTDRDD